MHLPAGCADRPCCTAARRGNTPPQKNLPAIAGESGIKALGDLSIIIIDGKLVNPLNIIIYVKIIFEHPFI